MKTEVRTLKVTTDAGISYTYDEDGDIHIKASGFILFVPGRKREALEVLLTDPEALAALQMLTPPEPKDEE